MANETLTKGAAEAAPAQEEPAGHGEVGAGSAWMHEVLRQTPSWLVSMGG